MTTQYILRYRDFVKGSDVTYIIDPEYPEFVSSYGEIIYCSNNKTEAERVCREENIRLARQACLHDYNVLCATFDDKWQEIAESFAQKHGFSLFDEHGGLIEYLPKELPDDVVHEFIKLTGIYDIELFEVDGVRHNVYALWMPSIQDYYFDYYYHDYFQSENPKKIILTAEDQDALFEKTGSVFEHRLVLETKGDARFYQGQLLTDELKHQLCSTPLVPTRAWRTKWPDGTVIRRYGHFIPGTLEELCTDPEAFRQLMKKQELKNSWRKVTYTSEKACGIWIACNYDMAEFLPYNRLLKQPLFEVRRIPPERLPEVVASKPNTLK